MKTKLIFTVDLLGRLIVSLLKSFCVLPEAFRAFLCGSSVDDFCGYVDSLTGLMNKKALVRDLKAMSGMVGVLVLDIDCFKAVNDTFGHTAGDRYLELIASTLRDAVDGHGRCYRIGGDEMLVLVNNDKCADILEFQVKAYFNSVLKVPVSIGASVGDVQSVILMADSKMYAHKRKKRRLPSPEDIRGVIYLASPHDRRSLLRSDRRSSLLSFSPN